MHNLIDREEAISVLRDTHLYITGVRIGKTILTQYTEGCRSSMIGAIQKLPAVENVQYIRHGHWINHGKTAAGSVILECSACNKIRSGGGRSMYCRDCGALMDEEG